MANPATNYTADRGHSTDLERFREVRDRMQQAREAERLAAELASEREADAGVES